MTRSPIEGEWEAQPDDPGVDEHGYEIDDWERIQAAGRDSEKFLYIPDDEELLREEAFIKVSPADVVDLLDNR